MTWDVYKFSAEDIKLIKTALKERIQRWPDLNDSPAMARLLERLTHGAKAD